MFFTRIGKVIAHVIFWGSIVRLALAFFVAFNSVDSESNRAASARYLATATSGEAINQAFVGLLLGLALGVLCEISARTGGSDRA
ncbi:hypothetical protein [Rhizobium sp. R86522]|uniref:hypothetical protein n=1 Tax=Rhizobium sp. R86522 TaxID=3093861 RepID=UPI00366D2C1F